MGLSYRRLPASTLAAMLQPYAKTADVPAAVQAGLPPPQFRFEADAARITASGTQLYGWVVDRDCRVTGATFVLTSLTLGSLGLKIQRVRGGARTDVTGAACSLVVGGLDKTVTVDGFELLVGDRLELVKTGVSAGATPGLLYGVISTRLP